MVLHLRPIHAARLALLSLALSTLPMAGASAVDPPRFWVCLHWAHPDGIEWTTTIINGDDQWEYLQKKYPGSYKGRCKVEDGASG